MRLYYHPASNTSRIVQLFALDQGVSLEYQMVDLMSGEHLKPEVARGKAAEIETRGVSDHGFIHSIYFRDPNGYVIELTAKQPGHDDVMNPALNGAREKLDRWNLARQKRAASKNS
jgi:catechol-2,3-dioxygenase